MRPLEHIPGRAEDTYASSNRQRRAALSHPNSFPTDPDPSTVAVYAERVVHLLRHYITADGPLAADALPDVVLAYEYLSDLEWHLPLVWGYVCGYWWGFPDDERVEGHPPNWSGFSAHRTRREAERWRQGWVRAWRKKGPTYTDRWVIREMGARVIYFREEGLSDSEIDQATGG